MPLTLTEWKAKCRFGKNVGKKYQKNSGNSAWMVSLSFFSL